MTKKLVLTLLTSSLLLSLAEGKSKLTLYPKDGSEPIIISEESLCDSGVLFRKVYEVSCVCLTGLWVFYQSDCAHAHSILAGIDDQCISLDISIRKVELLSSTGEFENNGSSFSAVAFAQNMISHSMKFESGLDTPGSTNYVPPGFPVLVTTGRQSWRLPGENLCLKPSPQEDDRDTAFCVFKHMVQEEYILEPGDCSKRDTMIEPLTCNRYLEDRDFADDVDPRSCHVTQERRHRRQAEGQGGGRVFLGAVTGLTDTPNGNSPDAAGGNATAAPTGNGTAGNDEDENSGLEGNIDQPILNSELWNYMTLRAKETLGIFKSKSTLFSRNNYSPAFVFLHYAKKIQQKACPNHYVRDDHYDVAVGAFASIQQNHFRYSDPFVDYETSTRIEGALMACLANITEYPFLERIYKNKVVECEGIPPITHGSYKVFDQVLELNVGHSTATRNNEPIVETVWKVFVHAHSACFPFFEKFYNDHHRFTTIMLPLFTNEINDIWFKVAELKPEIYSGFLGDAVDLMDSVAFCSAYSRLESEYPWDLPRPKKQNARRKREVGGSFNYECLEDMDARNMNKCLLDDPEDSFHGRNLGFAGNELET